MRWKTLPKWECPVVSGTPLPLMGQPPAVWQYGAADCAASDTDGIGEAVIAEKRSSANRGRRGSDKIGWDRPRPAVGGPHWHSLDSVPSPWAPAKENIYAVESLQGYIVSGCWEPKRKFRTI